MASRPADPSAPSAPCCPDMLLTWDTIDGFSQQVCRSCGAVSSVEHYERDSGAEGTTFTFASGRSVATNERLAPQRERISRGVLVGLRRIRVLCASLQCDDGLRRECEAAYRSALAHDELRCKSLTLKDAVAGACVYLKMRERDLPVTMTSVSNLLPSRDAFELGAAVRTLVDLLRIRVPPLDTADVVKAALSAAPRFSADDVAKVARLVELLRDLWVTAGRRHNTVILGAAFVYERLRTPSLRLAAFSKQFGAHASRQQIAKVAGEAERALLHCCSSLPWMRGVPVDMRAVRSNLDHMFRFKQCMLRSEATASSERDGGEGGAVSLGLLAAALEPYECEAAEVEAKLSRLDDPVLGESDIPESELCKFIRSPDEASALAEADAAMERPGATEREKWKAAGAIVSRKQKADSARNGAAS